MVVWGCNFAVVKTAIDHVPPISLIALRFVLVALVIVPFVKFPREQWKPIMIYGFLMGGIHFGLIVTGLRFVDAATVALLTQVGVPFATIIAAIVFKDYPGWRRWLGIAVAFIGAAIIAGEPRFEGGWLWISMVIMAALVWAIGSIQVKAMGEVNGWVLNGWMSVFAAPLLFAWSFVVESDQIASYMVAGWEVWGALLYQSFMVTIFGYGLWFWLLKQHPVSLLMPFSLLAPLCGVLAGVVFLGEPMTLHMIIGGALTLAGVGGIVLRRPSVAAETVAYEATTGETVEKPTGKV